MDDPPSVDLGRLAQLVERSLHTREVIGPNPIPPTSLRDEAGLPRRSPKA